MLCAAERPPSYKSCRRVSQKNTCDKKTYTADLWSVRKLNDYNFAGADLNDAWLVGAHLFDANLDGANLEGATLPDRNAGPQPQQRRLPTPNTHRGYGVGLGRG